MSITMNIFCFSVPLTMLFAIVLSVATIVGDCESPIFARAILMDVAFWHFSNNPTNSVSEADSMTFHIMLHSTCNGQFLWGIACIGLLDFFPRKNIHPLYLVPLVLICRMHLNLCGESFRFFCILLLCMDMLRCNLKIDLYVLQFLLLDFSIPPLVTLVPLTLWGIWT